MFSEKFQKPKSKKSVSANITKNSEIQLSKSLAKYDYILAGGGLSGQMMALELQKFISNNARVLIIDQDEKNKNDRTWSFWSTDPFWTEKLPAKTWKKIRVKGEGFDKKLSINPYRYSTIRGIDFYNFSKNRLNKDGRFDTRTSKILSVDSETGIVETEAGNFEGNLVFKSFFDAKKFSPQAYEALGYTFLYQQFKGWFVKTEKEIFDGETVTFMDFNTWENTNETRFFYILPFSKTEALVEYTAFTPRLLDEKVFDENLKNYFKEKLPTTDFQIKETEFDAIPMTDFPFGNKVVGRVISIGTSGGFVKASTGYCFARTHEKVQKIGKALREKGKVEDRDFTSSIHYRLFDSAMLRVTGNGRIPGEKFFISLFQKIPPQFLFRFLDEKASLREIIQTMLSVPGKRKLMGATLGKLLKINRL